MSRRKTIPVCPYVDSDYMARLSTFSHLPAHGRRRNISAMLLAGSGITFSTEEDFLECIHCAKVTMVVNAPATPTLDALTNYHQGNCPGLSEYIDKMEREIGDEPINIHQLKGAHRSAPSGGIATFDELLQMYGITPQ